MEVQDSKYDVSAAYDLLNHMKIPSQKKKTSPPISSNGSFHAQFIVLSALLTPIKLRKDNCSHRRHCESVVHSGYMIDIVILKQSVIVLHSALVHCGTPSWFVESEYYHTNTRSFFQLCKKLILLLTLKNRDYSF